MYGDGEGLRLCRCRTEAEILLVQSANARFEDLIPDGE